MQQRAVAMAVLTPVGDEHPTLHHEPTSSRHTTPHPGTYRNRTLLRARGPCRRIASRRRHIIRPEHRSATSALAEATVRLAREAREEQAPPGATLVNESVVVPSPLVTIRRALTFRTSYVMWPRRR